MGNVKSIDFNGSLLGGWLFILCFGIRVELGLYTLHLGSPDSGIFRLIRKYSPVLGSESRGLPGLRLHQYDGQWI